MKEAPRNTSELARSLVLLTTERDKANALVQRTLQEVNAHSEKIFELEKELKTRYTSGIWDGRPKVVVLPDGAPVVIYMIDAPTVQLKMEEGEEA